MRQESSLLLVVLLVSLVGGFATDPARAQDPPGSDTESSPPEPEAPRLLGTQASIAIGADGLPVIAYFDEINGYLSVAKCNDVACSGGDEVISTVDSSRVVGSYASMTIGEDDLPVIAYFDSTRGNLKVARCNDAACTGGDESISTVDSAGIVGLFSSIAIGRDGLPVISYFDRDNGDLKVAKCNDPACSGGDERLSTVDSRRCAGLFSSIAIGSDGLPLIAYYDSKRANLKVAKCNDVACMGGDETISTIKSEDPAGSHISVVLGSDGMPLISYYASGKGDLRVVHCNDQACSGDDERISTIDSVGLVGSYSSVAVGADGLPMISYHDLGNGGLKVAKCNDPACAGGDETMSVVDGDERVGSFSSLALDEDRLAVIVFSDAAAGSLRVARCENELCRP